MIRFVSTAIVLGLLAICLPGCTESKDLGVTCKMTRPGDNGPEEITEDKVENDEIDYIALGSAECDDLVCIRTGGSENPANESGFARGYCTAPCITDQDCEPDFEGNEGTLKCEQLLLDQAFLDALRQSDPTTYDQVFGSGAASKYCVKPRS